MTNATASTDRIIVGVDSSNPSREALRWAAFLAGTLHCSIEAVTAWQMPLAVSGPGAAVPPDWDPVQETADELERTVRDVLGSDPPVPVVTTVAEGGAARVLLHAAEDARMLVLGSRGLGGFSGMLMGSVSVACSTHAHCPVLVVHADTPRPPAG